MHSFIHSFSYLYPAKETILYNIYISQMELHAVVQTLFAQQLILLKVYYYIGTMIAKLQTLGTYIERLTQVSSFLHHNEVEIMSHYNCLTNALHSDPVIFEANDVILINNSTTLYLRVLLIHLRSQCMRMAQYALSFKETSINVCDAFAAVARRY